MNAQQNLTEADLRAADEAIWNADPSIPEADKFHAEEVYEDENPHLSHASPPARRP